MKKKIAIVGAGAIGGYVGGLLARSGFNVTLIDAWPEHVEAIRRDGLQLCGITPEERYSIEVDSMHISDVQSFTKGQPVDIAVIAVKSYDTEWATTMIRPYLSAGGYVVSMQNCINEERVAGIVGWGRTVGCVVAGIGGELYEAGKIRRTVPVLGPGSRALYVGEVHGRVTRRIEELAEILGAADDCAVTSNLWGERWAKLCVNVMRNSVSAVTGLGGNAREQNTKARRFSIRLVGEAVRVGQAHGFAFDHVVKHNPEDLALASEGNEAALKTVEETIAAEVKSGVRGEKQTPSMAQDIKKGRQTEIDSINGYIVGQAEKVGLKAPANAAITAAVKKVERGEITPSPESLPDVI